MSKSLRRRNKARVKLAQLKFDADEARKASQSAQDGAHAAALKLFRELKSKNSRAEASHGGGDQSDQTPAISAADAQGNSAFVARLASLEKSLAELQAPPSGSAMSATQASGPARKSTDEILADIQSVLASQQAQLHQLTEEQPSMFSGFRFGDVGSNE